jgi:hypothetical protein
MGLPYQGLCSAKSSHPMTSIPLASLETALLAFQVRYEKSAAPCPDGTFTREDLAKLMNRLKERRK